MRTGARPRAQGPQTQEATRITTPGLLPLLGYKDRETGLAKGISPDSKQQHTWDLGMHLRPPGGPDACPPRCMPHRDADCASGPKGRRMAWGQESYIRKDHGELSFPRVSGVH